MSALIIAEGKIARLYRLALQLNCKRIDVCALEDSVNHIKQCKADVVLLDCGYRAKTGISTLRQIKEAYHDTPVIFLTDLNSKDVAINAFKLGARKYFRKPVNIFELKRTVDHLLCDKQRASSGDRSPFASRDMEDRALHAKVVTSEKPQYILQVISYIEDNLRKPLELGHLAGKAHLSKFHFCRVFKRHMGMNPMKFVTSLRIERAKELLNRNDFTVSLVANEVGYKDLSNFIRQFKKITGVTPTLYRGTVGHEASLLRVPLRPEPH
ncbi:MAG: helix-turn-helix domain-containing protein [Betaproteobacteria bacterium]